MAPPAPRELPTLSVTALGSSVPGQDASVARVSVEEARDGSVDTVPYSCEGAMLPLDSRAAPTLSKLKTDDDGDGTLMTVT